MRRIYIGGTKVGALCGEAVVFTHNNAPKHFFTSIKQHGALLAKGRLLGVQFDALFTDDLYFMIAKNAIDKADRMRKAFVEKGYKIFIETVTNQIFIVLENSKMQELKSLFPLVSGKNMTTTTPLYALPQAGQPPTRLWIN